MHVTTRIFLLRVIDELMQVALQCPIAARRIRVEPTTRVHRDVGGFLDCLYGEIFGRLEDDRPLATDPGNHRRPVLVIMAPTRLTFLAAPPRSTPQRLLST